LKKRKRPYKIDTKKKEQWLRAYKETKSFINACKSVSITRQSMYDYLKKDLKFARGKKEIDDETIEVAVSNLHKRANGFEYTEVRVERENSIITKQTATKKFIAPDVGALVFLLCNKDPDNWKNTNKVEHTGDIQFSMKEFMQVIYDKRNGTNNPKFKGRNRMAEEIAE